MHKIYVEGGTCLRGETKVQGSKNAALPMMAASLLHRGCTVLHGCPKIADVFVMEQILKSLGVRTHWEGHTLTLDCKDVSGHTIPVLLSQKMRASVLLAGSLLTREGCVCMGYPGGCVIGRRPIDLHLEVLEKMGACKAEEGDMLTLFAARLHGIEYRFPKTSVGATENALLAAVLASGDTVLENAAREPEISALCDFLRKMGVNICEDGQGRICIQGGCSLSDIEYTIPPDRIAAGTLLLAGAATRGEVTLLQAPTKQLASLLSVYLKMGGQYSVSGGTLRSNSRGVKWPIPFLKTAAYPGYPTDLQPLLLAVCCSLHGESTICETVFEDRFRIVGQLQTMGANIQVTGNTAHVIGPSTLHGGVVTVPDLRAGAALVIAALFAQGETVMDSCTYIERGYETLYQDINLLGGRIRKEKVDSDETEYTRISAENKTEHTEVFGKAAANHTYPGK